MLDNILILLGLVWSFVHNAPVQDSSRCPTQGAASCVLSARTPNIYIYIFIYILYIYIYTYLYTYYIYILYIYNL